MSDPTPFWLPRMHIKRTLLTHLCLSFRENRRTGSWKKAVVARESLYHYYLTMTVYGVWVINKAGGLIFQRNYGGKPFPSPYLARPTIDSRLPPPLPVPSTPPSWLPTHFKKPASLNSHPTNTLSWPEPYTAYTPSRPESHRCPRVPGYRSLKLNRSR